MHVNDDPVVYVKIVRVNGYNILGKRKWTLLYSAKKTIRHLVSIWYENRWLGQIADFEHRELESLPVLHAHTCLIWKFNPPSAPYHDGVWERLVRSSKRVLGLFHDSPSQKNITSRTFPTILPPQSSNYIHTLRTDLYYHIYLNFLYWKCFNYDIKLIFSMISKK